MKLIRLAAFTMLCLHLLGCGATVSVVQESPTTINSSPKNIALLPADYPGTVARERVDYLRNALASELRNSGFVVLDQKLVDRTCSTPSCPERATLASKYLVDGFASLSVESVSRNNFVAGFYNTISGKLSFSDIQGKDTLSIDATEREKGGLLFNSGQVFQGLISQIENQSDDSFRNLGDRFAKTLVSKLPGISVGEAAPSDDAVAINISSVESNPIGNGVYGICATGTTNSTTYVVLNRIRSNLREVSPGRYCSNLLLSSGSGALPHLAIEMRSPYGTSVRKDLMLVDSGLCPLEGQVKLERVGNTSKVLLQCVNLRAKGKSPVGRSCSSVTECTGSRVVVYRASSPVGPYEKAGEFSSDVWTDNSKISNPFYQVVSIDKKGSMSLPIQPTDEEKKG